MDVWELFAAATHLHFENGDVLVLKTASHLTSEEAESLRARLKEVTGIEGIPIVIVGPSVEIAKLSIGEALVQW